MYFEIKKLKKIRHFRRLKNTEAMIYDRWKCFLKWEKAYRHQINPEDNRCGYKAVAILKCNKRLHL
jgi:hypothetical protein